MEKKFMQEELERVREKAEALEAENKKMRANCARLGSQN